MKRSEQREQDVQNLSGPDGIRARPSMYAGSSDSDGMWTSIREGLDNQADEAFAGRNDLISLARTGKHDFYMWDRGGGIPVGDIDVINPVSHKKEKVSALRAILTLSHTGSKFAVKADDEGGQRGTHGIGLKLSTAVSNLFQIWTCRQEGRRKQWYSMTLAKGRVTTDLAKCAAPKDPITNDPLDCGTLIYMSLDPSVFDKGSCVSEQNILNWFETTAFFSQGVSFQYHDGNELHSWESAGVDGYLQGIIDEAKASLLEDDAVFSSRGPYWDVALAFTDADSEGLSGFTNGLPNTEGGVHVTAVYDAMAAAVTSFAVRSHKFTPSDLREGVLGSVNIRLTACKFHNQAKTKLKDERADKPLREALTEEFMTFFSKRKALAKTLCTRATKMAELKNEFRQNKRVLTRLSKAKKKGSLPNKLSVALNCSNEERELLVVEGDSAGGSIRRARDSSFQECLPLKGKIVNAFGTKASVAIESEEVLTLLQAIGYDPSLDDPISNLRVGRLIILADPDVDGAHIQNLIISNILRFTPQIIEEGRLYACLPYEYMVQHKGKWYFDTTLAGLAEQVPASAMASAHHIKGWGEVDAEVLADMACNPSTRRLLQITRTDAKGRARIVELASTDASARKALLGVA